MNKLLIVIPLVFLFIGCREDERVPVEPKADAQAIKDLIVEFNAVFNTADIDKVLSYYADDVVRIPSNSPASIFHFPALPPPLQIPPSEDEPGAAASLSSKNLLSAL